MININKLLGEGYYTLSYPFGGREKRCQRRASGSVGGKLRDVRRIFCSAHLALPRNANCNRLNVGRLSFHTSRTPNCGVRQRS